MNVFAMCTYVYIAHIVKNIKANDVLIKNV